MGKNVNSITEELYKVDGFDLLQRTGVSLERLLNFLKVVQAGNIAKAADGDPSTQALYSRQLGELERALRVPLFEKDGRTRKLTPVGQTLASITAAFVNGLQTEVSAHRKGPQTIHIGCGEAVTYWILQPRMANLLDRFPRVDYQVEHASTSDTIEGVIQGRLHLAIVHDRADLHGQRPLPLTSMQFGLFYPNGWPKLTEKRLRHDLKKMDLITLAGRGAYVRDIATIGTELEIQWNIRARLVSLPMLVRMACALEVTVFLPLAAEEEMAAAGYACLKSPLFDRLTRNYVCVIQQRAASIQSLIVAFAMALVDSSH
ncbi:MAG: LysR family transcriptional regulator [Oceanipulchritudo sp.]